MSTFFAGSCPDNDLLPEPVSYTFRRLDVGPKWTNLRGGFPRRSAALAFALSYFADHDFEILLAQDLDGENDAIDIMVSRGDEMLQFAIEPEKL